MKKFTGFAAMSVLAFTVVGCSDIHLAGGAVCHGVR